MNRDSRRVETDHAPTPFTADQIRAGCPTGRTVTTRTVTANETSITITRFVATDQQGATMERDDGTRTRVTWLDLQRHASFPEADTIMTSEVISLALGRLDCLRYQVEREGGVDRFWFDTDRPGMPVYFTSERGGTLISESTVIVDEIT